MTILRIDVEPRYGNIVHVAVSGLSLQAPRAPGGRIWELSHLPFTEEAIDQSVTELVETLPETPISGEYTVWREMFAKGEAGVFAVPLGELIALTEESISQSAE